jgi:hypothetical protein
MNPDDVDRVFEKLLANKSLAGTPYSGTCTTVNTASPTVLTLAQLEEAFAKIGPEPIGEWMRSQGFPPETSLAVLPLMMRKELPIWPRYVCFSGLVASPTLVKDPSHATRV